MNKELELQQSMNKVKLGLLFILFGILFGGLFLAIGFTMFAVAMRKLAKNDEKFKKAGDFCFYACIIYWVLAVASFALSFDSYDSTALSSFLYAGDEDDINALYAAIPSVELKYYIPYYVESALHVIAGLVGAFGIKYLLEATTYYTDRYCNSLNNESIKPLKTLKIVIYLAPFAFALETLSNVLSYNAINTLVAAGAYSEEVYEAYSVNSLYSSYLSWIVLPIFIWYIVGICNFRVWAKKLSLVVPLDSKASNIEAFDVESEIKE